MTTNVVTQAKKEKEMAMSKEKIVVAGTDVVSAQQMSEFFRQAGTGDINGKVFQYFIEHQNPWPCRWTEKDDGVIILPPLISTGMTKENWVTYLKAKDCPPDDFVKSLLLHKDFKPSEVGKPHYVAIIKGSLFTDNDRFTSNILDVARTHQMITPSPEIACLIADYLVGKEITEMGLSSIVTMHDPLLDFNGFPRILGTIQNRSCLCAYRVLPNDGWDHRYGFAFEL
jgi:hypothetical protein